MTAARRLADAFDLVTVNEKALDEGGILAALPWSTYRTELRITVRIDRDGRRKFDFREWYVDDFGSWRAGRRGMNGLAGSELRGMLTLLEAATSMIPTRRTVRHRRRSA